MKRRAFIFLLGVISLHQPLLGQFDYGFDFSKSGTSGMQFLKVGVGAREEALGEAAVSMVHDANAVFWNAAGLGWVENRQIHATHNRWLVDSRHSAAVVALPVRSLVVGLSVVSLAIDDFEETTVEQPLGTGRMVSASDILLGLAVARRFTDRLLIGGQIKFAQEKLDEVTFSNLLFDVGTIYSTGFHNLRLGFSLQHFGPDKKIFRQKFRMPLLFRIGASDDLIQTANYRLSAAVDLVHPTDNDEWVNWGLELQALDLVAFRGGYRLNVDEGSVTLGAGLQSPGRQSLKLKIDYAYVSFGEAFGATHRFSLGLAF